MGGGYGLVPAGWLDAVDGLDVGVEFTFCEDDEDDDVMMMIDDDDDVFAVIFLQASTELHKSAYMFGALTPLRGSGT